MSDLAVRPSMSVDEMSVEEVIEQVQKVQQLMAAVMREGEHYGVIPGTQKPTLLKPGAEKLCLTFRLSPDYEIEKIEDPNLVSATAKCVLTKISTGEVWGSGVGSCNSMENKYRWRYVIAEPQPSFNEQTELKALGKGKRQKIDNKWFWMEKSENDNPMEYANTILKMACKRALVAAVLNATAASDIFTQDIEDLSATGVPGAAPAPIMADTATLETITRLREDLAEQAPDLWGDEAFLLKVRKRFGVEAVSELTEEQAQSIVLGAQKWALDNPPPKEEIYDEDNEYDVVPPDVIENDDNKEDTDE